MARYGPRPRPEISRFTEKYMIGPNECWLWTAHVTKAGYGIFSKSDRTPVYAHRWAYEHFVAPIPVGLQIDHLCRVRACVNPKHLEPVTSRENTRRGMLLEAKLASRKTHCLRGHPMIDSNLYLWRGRRRCRTCMQVRASAKWREAHPEARAYRPKPRGGHHPSE